MGKLYTYYENDFIIRDNYSRKYKDIGNNSEYELLNTLKDENKVLTMSDTHKSNDLSSICYAILEELSKTPNYPVKKCQNCGMYFIPKAKTDEIYCEYRRTYQQKFMQIRKDKSNTKLIKEFETWKKQAKEKINDMKKGKLTEDEVYNWIIKVKY